MSTNPVIAKLEQLEDFENAEIYGHAVARHFARACGMTFEQVVDDLDAALLSNERQRVRDFFLNRSSQ